MAHPHICKVKHGELEFFVNHGMIKAVELHTIILSNLCPEYAQDLI